MTAHVSITDANIVSVPELRFGTGKGTAIASFRIAANKRVKDKDTGEWGKGEASFYSCVAFAQRAERIIEENLATGELVFVSGDQEVREFTRKDGTKGTTVEIILDAFGRDYKWVNSNATKPKASSSSFGDEEAPPF